MPNTKTATKEARKNVTRNMVNKMRKSAIRTIVKKFNIITAKATNIDDTFRTKVVELFRDAQSSVSQGAKRGVLHRNTAARIISAMHKKLKSKVG